MATGMKERASDTTAITTRGIAQLLDVTDGRVYQLIKSGEIETPAVDIGRQRAFTIEQAFRIWEQRGADARSIVRFPLASHR